MTYGGWAMLCKGKLESQRSAIKSAVNAIDIDYAFADNRRKLIGLFYSTLSARTPAYCFPIVCLDNYC
jgi:hypothetical protein